MQLSIFQEVDEATERNRLHALKTYQWIRENREAFLALQNAVLFLHRENAPIQQGRIHSELAIRGYTLDIDYRYAQNRNAWPTLSRYLRAMFPELKESLHIRDSHIDGLRLPPIIYGYAIDGAIKLNTYLTRRDWL